MQIKVRKLLLQLFNSAVKCSSPTPTPPPSLTWFFDKFLVRCFFFFSFFWLTVWFGFQFAFQFISITWLPYLAAKHWPTVTIWVRATINGPQASPYVPLYLSMCVRMSVCVCIGRQSIYSYAHSNNNKFAKSDISFGSGNENPIWLGKR